VLAELAAASEAVVLEQLDRGTEEEPAVRLTAGRYFGDRLDAATATLGDLLKRAL
jgi:hypothetical protein